MKTVMIHGQSHKGSTYHIAHQLAGQGLDREKAPMETMKL